MTAETVVLRLLQLALPAFILALLLALASARGRGGWLTLPYALRRWGMLLVRGGWVLMAGLTLAVYFAWPDHPVAHVVSGPDRAAHVIRLFNTFEYRHLWQEYAGFGALAEPLLLWTWTFWLLLTAAAHSVCGLNARHL